MAQRLNNISAINKYKLNFFRSSEINKMEHSLYFLSYAVLATIVGIVALSAQYTRYKNEGTPFNATLLRLIGGFAMSMWAGVAVTEYVYAVHTSLGNMA